MALSICGHRGASAYAPENTLESFELAAKMGAASVELDVHLTKDDVLVVTHDETIERCSNGTGYVCEHTLKELKSLLFNKTHPEYATATIPTLEEVFELLYPTGLGINIELKNSHIDYDHLEQKTMDLAAKKGMYNRIILSSFSHMSLQRVKKIDPKMYCGLLYEASLIKPWAYAVALGMDAIHPHFSELLVPGGECAAAHKCGIEVNPWTVNSEEDIRATIREGADSIITNFPDRGLAIMAEMTK